MPSEFLISSIFLLIGVGVLLPWNAFISAKPYFQSRLCEGGGKYEDHGSSGNNNNNNNNIELWFGVVYNSSAVAALGFILVVQWVLERRKLAASEATAVAAETDTSPTTDDLDQNDVTLLEHEFPIQPRSSRSFDSGSEEAMDEKRHSFWMVRLPLSAYVAVFFATAIVVLIPSIPPSRFLQFTLSTLALCGPGACIGNAGILATAGLFPARVGINPFFQGQAVGGVAVAIANLIAATFQDPALFRKSHCTNDHGNQTRWMQLHDTTAAPACVPYQKPDWITFTYFGLGSFVLLACLVGYGYIEKYHHQTQYNPVQDTAEEITTSIRGIELNVEAAPTGETQDSETQNETCSSASVVQGGNTTQRVSSSTHPRRQSTGTRTVWLAVSGQGVSIFLTYVVTLALFPGWTSTLRSAYQCTSENRWWNDLYTPLSFVIFNAGDLLGRFLAPCVPMERFSNLSHWLVLASCLRFLFFLLFLTCESGASQFAKLALGSDLYSFAVQLLFAISNGLIVSVAFMHSSGSVPATTTIQQKVSELLNLAIGGGLLVGSLLSFPFARVATGHW